MENPWETEQWSVSPYNFIEGVTAPSGMPKDIIISDCTMRDGEQQAGVTLTKDDKLQLAHALDEIGIHEIEVGWPVVSENEREAIKAITSAGLKTNVRAVCRAVKGDIDLAVECGLGMIVLSLPTGDLQVKYKLKWPEERIIATAVDLTNYAHSKGLYVVLSPFDTTRTNPDFLERYLRGAVTDGHVDRVRMVDTVGCATPHAIKYLVEMVLEITNRPVEIHCHNDFGLATANTLAAIEAGATVASTAMNGMGERAGNTPTEEVALALRILYGIDLGLNFEKFYHASKLLQEVSNVPLQRHKAVVGDNAFAQESGMVVSGWLVNPFTSMALLPQMVGQEATVLIGKGSGKDVVKWKLDCLGLIASEQQLPEITSRVKEEAERTKSTLDDDAFTRVVQSVTG